MSTFAKATTPYVRGRSEPERTAMPSKEGTAVLLPHEPLLGMEKWLGGALGADGKEPAEEEGRAGL